MSIYTYTHVCPAFRSLVEGAPRQVRDCLNNKRKSNRNGLKHNEQNIHEPILTYITEYINYVLKGKKSSYLQWHSH